MKKTFVLDTNVLLHDPKSLFAFEEHDIIIPIVVLEELDKFKSEPGNLGKSSRAVARSIDQLREDGLCRLGSSCTLGEGLGNIHIYTPKSEKLWIGSKESNDNYIIATCIELKDIVSSVILVTNDVNMRCKADALGVIAQEYLSDKVDIDQVAKVATIYTDAETIDQFYSYKKLDFANLQRGAEIPELRENAYVTLKSWDNSKSALCRYQHGHLRQLKNTEDVFSIKPRNSEQRFLIDALMDENIDLILCAGTAGSGKTLLSLGAGLQHAWMGKKFKGHSIDHVMITKVIQEVGKDIGFLPGTKEEKMEEWVKPFSDNLELLMRKDSATISQIKDKHILEIEALTYMRGRSLMNRFVIIDETQNMTPGEVKTMITRIGNSSKLVLLGDLDQIDNPYLQRDNNGLAHAMERMAGLENVAVLAMTKSERSVLAAQAAERL